ncbi:hypothetical protein [Sphingomonas bacterium]|uniref:hypothetical protein n=1 Tax=Sphingomonas bacterium TaxID=1895847 RepID=UPI0015773842|nr:hypothetical protein [Sphingomonas bacterium]
MTLIPERQATRQSLFKSAFAIIATASILASLANAKGMAQERPVQIPGAYDDMKRRLSALESSNQALNNQVANLQLQLNNNIGATTAVRRELTSFQATYSRHTHALGFGFMNPATVASTNSPILLPFVTQANIRALTRTGGPTD